MAKKMPWHRARAIRDMIESWTPAEGVRVTVAITANQPCEHVIASLADDSGHAVGVLLEAGSHAGLSSIHEAMEAAQAGLQDIRRKCLHCRGHADKDEANESEPVTASSSTRLRTAPSVN